MLQLSIGWNLREPNPDLDHEPVPPDKDKRAPVETPPEEDQPDPPPRGDPKPDEPTRLVSGRIKPRFEQTMKKG